jgi:hypothetical protein
MIDPKSLRKGNWVEHKGKKRIIEEIGKFGIDLYADFDGQVHADISFEELDGIDLSPEIFIDFGFEDIPGHFDQTNIGSIQRYNFRKTVIKNNIRYTLEYVSTGLWQFQGVSLVNNPWHVHELQNLYYYLMNDELGFEKFE